MRIRSLTYAGKLRADRMLKPFVWEKLNLRFLPCSRTGTLCRTGTLRNLHPPELTPSPILAPPPFPAFLARACMDQAWTRRTPFQRILAPCGSGFRWPVRMLELPPMYIWPWGSSKISSQAGRGSTCNLHQARG